MNVCVTGCGHWGKNLARNFHEIGHLYALCEANENLLGRLSRSISARQVLYAVRRRACRRRCPRRGSCNTRRASCAHGNGGVQAGKDLFVEKPLALEWQDGRHSSIVHASANRILMVGHLLRLPSGDCAHSGAGRARARSGKIEYIYSNRLSMGKIRREENALWSFAPHDISVILRLWAGCRFR